MRLIDIIFLNHYYFKNNYRKILKMMTIIFLSLFLLMVSFEISKEVKFRLSDQEIYLLRTTEPLSKADRERLIKYGIKVQEEPKINNLVLESQGKDYDFSYQEQAGLSGIVIHQDYQDELAVNDEVKINDQSFFIIGYHSHNHVDLYLPQTTMKEEMLFYQVSLEREMPQTYLESILLMQGQLTDFALEKTDFASAFFEIINFVLNIFKILSIMIFFVSLSSIYTIAHLIIEERKTELYVLSLFGLKKAERIKIIVMQLLTILLSAFLIIKAIIALVLYFI